MRSRSLSTDEDNTEERVPVLPNSNAATAIVVVVLALGAAIVVLVLLPGQPEALATAGAMAASGFALAAKLGIPRRR